MFNHMYVCVQRSEAALSLCMQEVIREAPRSLAALLEVLLPRLQPRSEVRGVSLEDQQNLVS